ncbi:ABC transporter permease [Cellulomonas massiliensis]|uniref:ABC transporter permease n=1 Tax=Cellulomonas massiliensis TaxID=1465811 RepID=UPI0002EB5D74|nr:ABC transporter permease [Cellulomonas massiliensis]
MSAAVVTGVRPVGTPRRGVTAGGVVAAEWTKLTSLRSPWWTAVVTVLVAGVITWLSANASSVDPGFVPADSISTGLLLAQLGPLVLGVLVGAGEFRTGGFRSTFTVVPRRWPVLAAQAVVTAAFGLGLAVVTVAACVAGVLPAAASRGMTLDLAADGTPGVLVGMVLLLVGLALLGLAVGALLRRTVPALVTAIVLVFLLPVVLMLASDPLIGGAASEGSGLTVTGTVGVLLPGTAGQLMTLPAGSTGMDGAPALGPVGGGLVLAAWVLVLLGLAAVRLRTRDVT